MKFETEMPELDINSKRERDREIHSKREIYLLVIYL